MASTLAASSPLRLRCGRAIVLVAMMPRLRIAVLKAPTPAEPALVRRQRDPDDLEQPQEAFLLGTGAGMVAGPDEVPEA